MFSVVMVPLALAGVALDGPAARAGDVALRIAGAGIQLLHEFIDRALAVPNAAVTVSTSAAMGSLCMLPILGWTLFPRAWPGRHVALLAVLALVSGKVQGPHSGCILDDHRQQV